MLEPRLKPEEVRELLIRYRAENSLTLRGLAKKIGGLTFQTLGNVERGSVWPKRTTLLRIELFLRRVGAIKEQEVA